MSLVFSPEVIWLVIAALAAAVVLGCLRVIGFAYFNAVRWHNLKVEVHQLRNERTRRLRESNETVEALPDEPSLVATSLVDEAPETDESESDAPLAEAA